MTYKQKWESINKQTNKRIETVDIAKGIGIILVILGHLVSADSKTSTIIFSFHMPLFYIMSGYLLSSNFTRVTYIKKDVNILLNYAVYSLIGLFATIVIPSYLNSLTIRSLIYDVIYNTQPECIHVGQLWFLFSMIWGIGIFWFIHIIFKDKIIPCLLSSMFIATVSIIISKVGMGLYLFGEPRNIPFKILPGMTAVFFLEIGYCMKKIQLINRIKKIIIRIRLLLIVALSLIVGISSIINGKVNIALGVYNNVILYYITSVGGTLLIILFSSILDGKVAKIVGHYGKESMCIFAIHSLYLYAYAKILSIIFGTDICIMNNINLFMSVIGTVIITILLYPMPFIYEKTIGKFIHYVINYIK